MALDDNEEAKLRAELDAERDFSRRMAERMHRIEAYRTEPAELDRHKTLVFESFRPSHVWKVEPRHTSENHVQVYPPLATDAKPLGQELYVRAWTSRADGLPEDEGAPAELWQRTEVGRREVQHYRDGVAGIRAEAEAYALRSVHRTAKEAGRVVYRVDMRWMDCYPDPREEIRQERDLADIVGRAGERNGG